jgi:methylenetetrahydrofolate dehydrogenase (NADP+)/methenyltetrahydrofolate cyclohydrolase
LPGRRAVILAKSEVFASPLKQLLEQKGVEVVFVTPSSTDFIQHLLQADVVVVAIGQPRFLKDRMIKEGVVVIDVGYNRMNDKAVGDVDFESVGQKASWVTPVPGGVGPMTVAMLLSNVLSAYDLQKES